MRGWAGVGACSAEGVWNGPNPAGGRRGDPEAFEGRQVCIECSRKPVKQHICCFYWLTRGGEVAAVGLAGADFRYTKSFRAAGVRFYLHKLIREWSFLLTGLTPSDFFFHGRSFCRNSGYSGLD